MTGLTYACMTGCGESPTEPVQSTRPLALTGVTVGAPFEVEAPPLLNAAQGGADVTCGSSRCLVSFMPSNYGSARPHTAFELLELDGTTVASSLHSATGGVLSVAPVGENFVVGLEEFEATGSTSRVLLISGTDGSVLSDLSSALQYQRGRLASNGTTLLVENSGPASGPTATRVFDVSTWQPIGAAVPYPFTARPYDEVLSTSTEYLVRQGTSFVRISATTGQRLDASVRTLTAFKPNLLAVRGAAVGGTYVFVLMEDAGFPTYGRDLYVIRVNSDGTVLDADDTFNQISGAKPVCIGCGFAEFDVVPLGGDAAVFMAPRPQTALAPMSLSRVSAATGLTRHGSTTAPEVTSSVANTSVFGSFEAYVTPTGGFFVDESYGYVYQHRLSLDVSVAPAVLTLDSVATIGKEGAPRTNGFVATNGTDFLVGARVGADIVMSCVDGTTGTPKAWRSTFPNIDGPVAVSSNGTDFLFVFTKLPTTSLSREIHGVIITPDGNLGTDLNLGYSNDYGTVPRFLSLTWNGANFLLTWIHGQSVDLAARRLASDGTLIDTAEYYLNTTYVNQTYPVVVVADRPTDPATRTFMVGYTSPPGFARVRRVRSSTGSVINPETPFTDGSSSDSVLLGGTADATRGYFVWSQNFMVLGGTFDPVGGGLSTTPRTLGFESQVDVRAMVHDGYSALQFGMVPYDPEGWLRLQRYDTTMTPLDAAWGALGQPIFQLQSPQPSGTTIVAVSNGAGRTLLVTDEYSYERRTQRMVGRFIDNDGSPSEPPDAGVDAGTDVDAGTGVDGGASTDAGADTSTGGDSSAGGDTGITKHATGGCSVRGVAPVRSPGALYGWATALGVVAWTRRAGRLRRADARRQRPNRETTDVC